jgi:hypothetical protein
MSTEANEATLLSEPKNQKRIAANQQNAQRSTGPKSATGKATICLNAFRHGLAGRVDYPRRRSA